MQHQPICKLNNIMKTCLLSVLLCLSAASALAQRPVKWGLQAGLNLSSFVAQGSDFDDIRTKRHRVSGFQAGLTATLPFTKALLLRTGLQVERRGFAFEINQSNIHYEALYRPYYLQIPAVLALTNGRFYAGAGLYIAYGVVPFIPNGRRREILYRCPHRRTGRCAGVTTPKRTTSLLGTAVYSSREGWI